LVTALIGESSLRMLSGLLTIYLAFYVESTAHGLAAAVQLGGVVVAAGAGNLAGTAIGTKLKLPRPELLIVIAVAAAAASCLLVALLFDIVLAIVGMFISAVTNSMSKVSLDTLIQRDVAETLRSSAFGRSETFLQLAWVLGAALGVLLPTSRHVGGALGFWVAGGIMACVATVVILHARTSGATAAPAGQPPGSVKAHPSPPA
jgi:predicted MFS family arabinose efflux permease